MDKKKFDLIVIGGGPGGYVAAIRGAQRNLQVALIEVDQVGGTCLNRGCIPSKALIANASVLRTLRHAQSYGIHCQNVSFDYAAMKDRKDHLVQNLRKGLEGLIQSNRITLFKGRGKFVSEREVKVVGERPELLEAPKIIIATGSEPRPLPLLPFDQHQILDSTAMLNLTQLPKKLVIVGGGVIGCEFASLHRNLDVDVTICELLPTILSTEGKDVAQYMTRLFKSRGIRIELNARIERLERRDDRVVLSLADGQNIEADCVLVSVGRKYNSDDLGLENVGIAVAANGAIEVNQHLETNRSGIYAIGDVTGQWILAHVASHQGLCAADHAAGLPTQMHHEAIPSVIFTDPEIASVGLTLERALERGYPATRGKFPFQALGKAQAAIQTEGFAQVVIDAKSGQILGAQVVGHEASALIGEMTVAIHNELTVEALCDTIHAHPTLSEAWMEAGFVAMGMPLHLPPKAQS